MRQSQTEILNNLAANFKRLLTLARPVIQKREFDSLGAVVIVLAALGWELVKALVAHPDIFVVAPFAAVGLLLVLAAMFGIAAREEPHFDQSAQNAPTTRFYLKSRTFLTNDGSPEQRLCTRRTIALAH
jgi:hypothetical protein